VQQPQLDHLQLKARNAEQKKRILQMTKNYWEEEEEEESDESTKSINQSMQLGFMACMGCLMHMRRGGRARAHSCKSECSCQRAKTLSPPLRRLNERSE
jgi:hypothetical protein